MSKIISFILKRWTDILLVFLLVFLFYTGKFNILYQKVVLFFKGDLNQKTAEVIFYEHDTNKEVKLTDYKNKVLVVNFWATWCTPCNIETPALVDLYNKHHKSGFEIIGVSLDSDTRSEVPKFIKDKNIPYKIVYPGKGINESFGNIESMPTTFLLNKDLIIKKKYLGLFLKSPFENEIKKLL